MTQKDQNQLKMPLLEQSLPISSYQLLSKNQILNKFYEIIPFKCPFCFSIIELTLEFIEHLSINHFFNLKIRHDKLNEISNKDDSIHVSAKRKMPFKIKLNEYEPSSKRVSYAENSHSNEIFQEKKSDPAIKACEETITEIVTLNEDCINITSNIKPLLEMNSLQKSETNSKINNEHEETSKIVKQTQNESNFLATKTDVQLSKDSLESETNILVVKKDIPPIKPKIISLIEKQVTQNSQKLNYQLDSVSCGLCALTFKYQSNLIKHLKKKHIKAGQKLCDKEFEKFMITNFNMNNNNNNIISTITKDELTEKHIDI